MTYRLDRNAPLTETLRASAREQVDGAIASPADVDDLVRLGLGRTCARENAAFRDLVRGFSQIRDAQILAQTIDTLAEHPDRDATARKTARA